MSKWKDNINIAHLHRLYNTGKINIVSLGKAVGSRLKKIDIFLSGNADIADIVNEFELLDQYSSLQDYKVAIDMLYDFGDKNNQLWIDADCTDSVVNDIASSNNCKVTYSENTYQSPADKKTIKRSRAHLHITQYELDLKFSQLGINAKDIAKDMYDYIKDADIDYQAWLLERCEIMNSNIQRKTPQVVLI